MISFTEFIDLSDQESSEIIRTKREKLGNEVIILCHHYQRADVYQFADLTGDSLKLSRLAADSKSPVIVFCGVHFMAEVADILSKPEQISILPDLAAGCSMADMANLAKVERCWQSLSKYINVEEEITPVTYINSAADLKAFCGRHGGIVCTSSNAALISQWALGQREKILFFPDQHLGRWTGHSMGYDLSTMVVWDPDLPDGGLTGEQIKAAKFILWKGHCSVHQMFQKEHIDSFRQKYPEGKVIAHPECNFAVCSLADKVGSTEYIVKTIKDSPPGSHWLVGTELNLVERLAKEMLPLEVKVQFMATTICMCSTMQRIDPQHLAWVLANLAEGNIVNRISVPEHEKDFAKLALNRMLDVSK